MTKPHTSSVMVAVKKNIYKARILEQDDEI